MESFMEHNISESQKEVLAFLKHIWYYSLYNFLREPSSLDEFDWKKMRKCILWRDNGTAIVIDEKAYKRYAKQNVCFELHNVGKTKKLEGCILGADNASIAETVTFLWSLKHKGKGDARLKIDVNMFDSAFFFSALQPEQLAIILDSNPTRHIVIQAGIWSPEQTLVLASRPYPLHLTLTRSSFGDGSGFRFKDGGTAFVNGLEERKSSFGSLIVDFSCETGDMPFLRVNVKRLSDVCTFQKLNMGILDRNCVFDPFSVKADALVYEIDEMFIQPSDFDDLHIVTKDLSINFIIRRHVDDYDELLISFLNRVAKLGHLERLAFSVHTCKWFKFDKIGPVAAALSDAVNANPNLTHLDLSNTLMPWNWVPHLKNIFEGIVKHKGLRTLVLRRYPLEDPAYSWLEQLLSRNQDIAVLTPSGKKCSNGSSIDKLYLFNRFYHGSAKLVKESASLRPLLVATALLEGASENYKPTVLLLSNHVDILCEFIDGVNLENFADSDSTQLNIISPASIPRGLTSGAQKRMRTSYD